MSSFPLILQHDSMQCGVACLAMVCSHYGREYSLETLSKYCSPTAKGIFLLPKAMRQTAAAYADRTGYHCRPIRMPRTPSSYPTGA